MRPVAVTKDSRARNSHGPSLPGQLPEARSIPIDMASGAKTPPEARPPGRVDYQGEGGSVDEVGPHLSDRSGHTATPLPSYATGLSQTILETFASPPHEPQGDNGDRESHPVKHRRAPVACRRCRRLRSKCQHTNAQPPCVPCFDAGPQAAAECFFPARGEPDRDREFRRRRLKASEKQKLNEGNSARPRQRISNTGIGSSNDFSDIPEDLWDLLPPLDEVIEGCRLFFTSYFQLGFLPKAMFIERLQKDHTSVNPFLLLGLLAISARFVPKLVHRYGGSVQATQLMIDHATKLVPQEMYHPDLERIQGFFLLSVAEWGNGDRTRSLVHMGIAVRMAGILGLHREEAYIVTSGASADEIVNSEVARRTFWVIISQEGLHSGATTPSSFSLGDITALLPCDEGDFAFGIIPKERAAISGTMAAKYDESSVWLPSRSLFATLIQAHTLWGQCARASTRQGDSRSLAAPWQPSSQFAELSAALQQWEQKLPKRQRWSLWNLRGYRSEGLDLAYLAVVMVLRLSNIVIRRVYLEDIINAKACQNPDCTGPTGYWDQMANDLFTNVLVLHEQIDAYFTLRSKDEGFPAIIVFCIYTCGSLAYYLANWPQLCSPLAAKGPMILNRSMQALKDLSSAWPLAMRWQQALSRVLTRPEGPGTIGFNAQRPPQEQYPENVPNQGTPQHNHLHSSPPSAQPSPAGFSSSANLDLLANAAAQTHIHDPQRQQPTPNASNPSPSPHANYLDMDGQQAQLQPQQYFSMAPAAFAADGFDEDLNEFFQRGEAAVFWNGVSGMTLAE